jgi:hypothetical protein
MMSSPGGHVPAFRIGGGVGEGDSAAWVIKAASIWRGQ